MYLSVPFCRAKCSFCNFSSDVGSVESLERYVARLCREIQQSRSQAARRDLILPERVDTVYFGGGTPSLLSPGQVHRIFGALRESFLIDADAEITMEAAPGQIADDLLEEAQRQGVNRISLGVQSFVDREAASVARLHTGNDALREIDRLRREGVAEVGVDLIAGLPHQTKESWQQSLDAVASSPATHLSVYMLEIDEDSRLGREVLAGGSRFHAHAIADEDLIADLYQASCAWLPAHGFAQYEISNFARVTSSHPSSRSHESSHNRKYWERAPYFGLGLDAHSMLHRSMDGAAVRFANSAEMHDFEMGVLGSKLSVVSRREAFEETVFLGLRLLQGIDLLRLRTAWPVEWVDDLTHAAAQLSADSLMTTCDGFVALTTQGRLLSNEVFGRLLEAVPA